MSKEQKRQRSCKQAMILFLMICILQIFCIIDDGRSIYQVISHKSSEFKLTKVYDPDWKEESYRLMAGKKSFGSVDYDTYMKKDVDGATHFKEQMLLDLSINLLIELIIILLLGTLIKMASSQAKEFRPFCHTIIRGIQRISIGIMMLALMPEVVRMVAQFLVYLRSTAEFSIQTCSLFLVGAALWKAADLFRYGNTLQEELDTIA